MKEVNLSVYTLRLIGSEEIISKIDNLATAEQDGFYLLYRPRIVQPTQDGKVVFIPLTFSLAEKDTLRLPIAHAQFLPELAAIEFSSVYEKSISTIALFG